MYILVNTEDSLQRCTKYFSQCQTITLRIHTWYSGTPLLPNHGGIVIFNPQKDALDYAYCVQSEVERGLELSVVPRALANRNPLVKQLVVVRLALQASTSDLPFLAGQWSLSWMVPQAWMSHVWCNLHKYTYRLPLSASRIMNSHFTGRYH